MTRETAKIKVEQLDYYLSHTCQDYGERDHEAMMMAIKALEQEPIFSRVLEKTYNDFCNCDGGEGWIKIDGKEYSTDAGYAIEGVEIFMKIFKRRLSESED
jgi:hypothetical protein